MRVLVIGGSGFIGPRLIDALLERGHTVANLDATPSARHPELTVLGDVRDRDRVVQAASGVDVIVNLAAAHRDDIRPLSLYDEINIGGAESVVAAAEAAGVSRILFTSTVAIYGLDNENATEDSKPRPFNDYGRTKLEAEQRLIAWARRDAARRLVIIRPSVVFGEGNRGNVYNLANQVATGRFLMIGDGSNRKSMSYVGNIAAFLADHLDAPSGVTVMNYADKPDLSTREIITIIEDQLGRRTGSVRLPLALGLAGGHVLDLAARLTRRTFPISAVRIRKFVASTTVNTDRLLASGYRPRYSLEEALRRTVAAEFRDAP
ncbi:MAG: NAD-dependent epimerase/dehydratase family protein [Rhodoglobus sp.]